MNLQQFTRILDEINAQPSWRREGDISCEYYDGNQLGSAILADMKRIGMAPVVENVIGPAVDAVLGLEAKTRSDWRVTSESDDVNDDMADALNLKLKEAERNAKADSACGDAFASQVKAGVGWVEVSRSHDPFDYEYRAREVHRNEMNWDMKSREKDLSDARWLVRRRWVDTDVASMMFKDQAGLIKHVGNAWRGMDSRITDDSHSTDLAMNLDIERAWSIEESEWRDTWRNRVCLYEVWYREPVAVHVLRSQDGRVVEYDADDEKHQQLVATGLIQPEPAIISKVRLAWWLGPHRLLDMPSPYRHRNFPYVPFWAKVEDRTRVPYGLIRPMRPMQDEINMRNSKLIWLLSAKRVTATSGAVDDPDKVREEVMRPDAYIELNDEAMRTGGVFKVESDFALSQQQYQTLVDKREAIKNVSGIYNAFMGNGKNGASSGIAMQTVVEQANQTLADIFDNYRDARAAVGEMLLSLIIEDMGDAPQDIVVVDDFKPRRTVKLNQPATEDDGFAYLTNDVQRTRLKVALSDVPSTASYRAQQLLAMSEWAKSLPPELQIATAPYLLALTDVPHKKELMATIKKGMGLPADGEEAPQITPQMVQEQIQQAVQQALMQSGMEKEQALLALEDKKVAGQEQLKMQEMDIRRQELELKTRSDAEERELRRLELEIKAQGATEELALRRTDAETKKMTAQAQIDQQAVQAMQAQASIELQQRQADAEASAAQEEAGEAETVAPPEPDPMIAQMAAQIEALTQKLDALSQPKETAEDAAEAQKLDALMAQMAALMTAVQMPAPPVEQPRPKRIKFIRDANGQLVDAEPVY